ncbi:efflux transporter outer membrane subunit [Pseudoduganella sp. FT26W]|uniref:Efflux transporter outer membrane subunit n=1 Tax=Duganella aquatilis TaxID=2666082 RepID=A0A844D787_9BURK|nr:efflux transporter outer membrane subunit [Duganella aquatilis]
MTTVFAQRLLPVVAPLWITACSTPAFKQPAVSTPVAFKESQHGTAVQRAADGSTWKMGQPAEAQPRGEWWRAFADPALDQLIAQANASNQNAVAAAARVKQARAIAGIAEADRYPNVGAALGAQRAHPSALELNQAPGTPTPTTTSYSARLSASYEVDLFGRVSSNLAAARGDADVAMATYRSVLMSLQADVAQTYLRLRALDAELLTVEQTVRLREESVRVTSRRFELGDIGEFDLSRAKTELGIARAEAIGLQRQRALSEHALAVLVGQPAADFSLPANPLAETSALPVIPAGLPSALLERRPDIVGAQRAMQAANARIGVARSAMFPAFDINAGFGGVGGSFSDVFKWSSRSWLLGAAMGMPLIDGGRNQQNVVRSEAVLEEAVAAYRQSVLTAFAEVDDSLAGLRVLSDQSAAIEAALGAARRSADLAQRLYDAGRGSYLELLDAQRNLALVERNVVQLRGDRAMTTVALIRALGGGWG